MQNMAKVKHKRPNTKTHPDTHNVHITNTLLKSTHNSATEVFLCSLLGLPQGPEPPTHVGWQSRA